MSVRHLYLPFFTDIDQLITIAGMVIRTSPLIPEMREGESPAGNISPPLLLSLSLSSSSAFFRCYVCKETKSVEIDRGRIAEPAVCPNCQTLHSMALVHNHSLFTDKQMIKLQESPGTVQCCVHSNPSFQKDPSTYTVPSLVYF